MELKELWRKQKLKGVFVQTVDSPAMPLIAQQAGMDFIFYDCEHGSFTYDKLTNLILLGNGRGFPSIVRVAQLARADVSGILDCGASGVMVPMMETKEQAEQFVGWSKYPPEGIRSYSGGPHTDFGPSGNHEHRMKEMNHRTMAIAQIETVKGVENVDEILSVNGIDAAIVGPCDLGISMGNPDNVMDEWELAMIQKVADSCRKHGKAFGIIGGNQLLKHFYKDVNILVSAIDAHMLRDCMKKAVEEYNNLEE
ncbi:HpcH/HpaI aldolase family protein [Hominiventricola aquisgranensis]|uniref:Aldolase/citrate lyase family protein n=1 Tax=Hominiventricola aquisgranensis TaxID=3133164 RepID=A0ABV1HX09_9FIRM